MFRVCHIERLTDELRKVLVMKRSLVLACCSLVCVCGCSAGKGTESQSSLTARAEKIHDVQQLRCFRDSMRKLCTTDDQFSLTCEDPESPFSCSQPLSYGGIDVLVHFPPLRPNVTCFLYCPATGCPIEPELLVEYRTNAKGNPIPAQALKGRNVNDLDLSITHGILLYANPGYCSDWYLVYLKPFSAMHTAFTYKPITVSDKAGRTLTIQKLEPGGNYLEVVLRGFQPKQQLQFSSCSAGETITKTIDTDENGSYSCFMLPQVVGVTRGNERVTISYEGETLETSCDWDVSTLDIKRSEPYTFMWRTLHSLKLPVQ
jgi:hypothetical protein